MDMTIWSMQETMALANPWLPGHLADPVVLARIGECARCLPELFSSYYLEYRLRDGDPRVDLLASIAAPARASRAHLDRTRVATELACLETGSPAWERVKRFARAWADPDDRLHAQIPLVWLEFDDMHREAGGAPEPCFHACVDRNYLQHGDGSAASRAGEEGARDVIESLFEALLGQPLPAATSRALHACCERLGPGGRMIHVSVMLSRTPAAIKIYGCVPRQDLHGYLQRIEWPGCKRTLDELLDGFCLPDTVDDTIYFDLALDEHVTPYIGIVFSQMQLGVGDNCDPRRKALLDRLVAGGLCAPDKRDAALAWPGSTRVVHASSSTPARLRRWLDIKLGHRPGLPLEAKAYLGISPVFSLF
jgi:hypothetical protein